MTERIDPKRLPVYQNGAEGCIAFIEENVKFEVPDRNGRPRWLYPTQLSDDPDPVTGKSFKGMWEKQKDELREALAMKNGKFKYRVVVFLILLFFRGYAQIPAISNFIYVIYYLPIHSSY